MRRARLIPVLFSCVSVVLLPRASKAQWQWTSDVGLSHLRQEGIDESSALTLGTAVDAYTDRAWLRVSGLAARASEDRWTGQGVVVGSLLGPATHLARWELSASASAFAETGAGPSTSFAVMGGARFGSSRAGVSFDGGGGATQSPAFDARALLQAQVGAWRLFDANTFAFNVSLTGISAPTTPTVNTRARVSRTSSFVDASAAWRRDHNGWSASVAAGARGASAGVSEGAWAAGEAAAWVSSHLALVGSAGRSLEDPIRGIPSTRYVSASIRIVMQPHERLGGAPKPRVVAGRERVEIALPKATNVELMADFTDWSPVSLVRTGGVWRLERSIPPGLHRVAIRIDGGEWIAPPGLPHATDDLGGVVGLITIP